MIPHKLCPTNFCSSASSYYVKRKREQIWNVFSLQIRHVKTTGYYIHHTKKPCPNWCFHQYSCFFFFLAKPNLKYNQFKVRMHITNPNMLGNIKGIKPTRLKRAAHLASKWACKLHLLRVQKILQSRRSSRHRRMWSTIPEVAQR